MAGVGTSATYYQDVQVPVANRVGEENGGWKLVTNQLNHERVALVHRSRSSALNRFASGRRTPRMPGARG